MRYLVWLGQAEERETVGVPLLDYVKKLVSLTWTVVIVHGQWEA